MRQIQAPTLARSSAMPSLPILSPRGGARGWDQLRISICVGVCASLLTLNLAQPAAAGVKDAPPPNIVFIVLDDLGYGDLGSYGSTFIETPNLDTLAAEGMRFSQYYATAPVCSPTRISLLTGRYPTAFGLRQVLTPSSKRGIPAAAATLPRMLSQAGYATAHFGKWHVGSSRPEFEPAAQGFSRYAYVPHGIWNYWDRTYQTDAGPVATTGHRTEVTTDFAIQFLQDNQQNRFFLQVWYFTPHVPLMPPPSWAAQYPDTPEGLYAAMVSHGDEQIGRLLTELRNLGLDDSTLVVVASDNGGEVKSIPTNGNLRGYKYDVFEGGIRVPQIVRWTGTMSAGAEAASVFTALDWFPTLTRLAGLNPNAARPDGRDMRDVLDGTPVSFDGPIFWEATESNSFFSPPSGNLNYYAVRQGPWKLVQRGNAQNSPPRLYNIDADPTESQNLAGTRPDLIADLTASYRAWRKRSARLPHSIDHLEGTANVTGNTWSFQNGAVVLTPDLRFDFHDGDFSLQARVRVDALGVGDQTVAERAGSWNLFVDDAGFLRLRVEGPNPAAPTLLASSSALSAGVEHDVVVTVYGYYLGNSTVRLYLDGVLQQETNAILEVASTDAAVVVGRAAAGANPLQGTVRDLRFYVTSLIPSEIAGFPQTTVCDDGLDNDGDGSLDYPTDLGCRSYAASIENPSCQDGLDNDGDGVIDFDGGASSGLLPGQTTNPDAGCRDTPWRIRERIGRGCGLGFELVGLVALMRCRRKRVRL